MADLVLIDGNNLAYRVFWTHKELTHGDSPTGLLYGFVKSLVMLKKRYKGHFFIVAWEGGYDRRRQESEKAVEDGIVPSSYKANREARQDQEELDSFFTQMDQLKDEFLPAMRVLQARVESYEADDVIYTYAVNNAEQDGQTVVVSSDKDFMVLLQYPNVLIYDAMKQQTWTAHEFEAEFGFPPSMWTDVGAIMGDKSDNIFGVPGWGISWASKYIREYGDCDKVIAALQAKPEKKRGKKEQAFLEHLDRLRVARSLKKMDAIPFIPKLRIQKARSEKALCKLFIKYGFASMMKKAAWLV